MTFKKEHVRILREALAFLGNKQHSGFASVAIDALKKFGLSVRDYCDHSENVYIEAENAQACLFCGVRFAPDPIANPPIMGGGKK